MSKLVKKSEKVAKKEINVKDLKTVSGGKKNSFDRKNILK